MRPSMLTVARRCSHLSHPSVRALRRCASKRTQCLISGRRGAKRRANRKLGKVRHVLTTTDNSSNTPWISSSSTTIPPKSLSPSAFSRCSGVPKSRPRREDDRPSTWPIATRIDLVLLDLQVPAMDGFTKQQGTSQIHCHCSQRQSIHPLVAFV